jgi:hypothetical protein
MTTIVVPPDLEAALVAQAQIEHTTPEQLALDTLRRHFLRPPAAPVESTGPTLEDFLKGFIGTVNGSSEAMARKSKELFAESLMEKKRRGHL